MYCSKCGLEIKSGDSFCPSCGAKVVKQQQKTQQADDIQVNISASQADITAESKGSLSLVMGILSLVFCWCIIGLIFGPIAVSSGNTSRKVPYEKNQKFWVALAGIITGWIGLGMSILYTLIWIIVGIAHL